VGNTTPSAIDATRARRRCFSARRVAQWDGL
jgi:hypothetical protein